MTSGAGDYIDKVFRDMEASAANSDSTIELGSIVNFRFQKSGQQATVY